MATSTIKNTKVKRVPHQYTGITGSANTNIVLSNDVASDVGAASYVNILAATPASDAGFSGAVYTVFLNTNALYLKSDIAISSGSLNILFAVLP